MFQRVCRVPSASATASSSTSSSAKALFAPTTPDHILASATRDSSSHVPCAEVDDVRTYLTPFKPSAPLNHPATDHASGRWKTPNSRRRVRCSRSWRDAEGAHGKSKDNISGNTGPNGNHQQDGVAGEVGKVGKVGEVKGGGVGGDNNTSVSKVKNICPRARSASQNATRKRVRATGKTATRTKCKDNCKDNCEDNGEDKGDVINSKGHGDGDGKGKGTDDGKDAVASGETSCKRPARRRQQRQPRQAAQPRHPQQNVRCTADGLDQNSEQIDEQISEQNITNQESPGSCMQRPHKKRARRQRRASAGHQHRDSR